VISNVCHVDLLQLPLRPPLLLLRRLRPLLLYGVCHSTANLALLHTGGVAVLRFELLCLCVAAALPRERCTTDICHALEFQHTSTSLDNGLLQSTDGNECLPYLSDTCHPPTIVHIAIATDISLLLAIRHRFFLLQVLLLGFEPSRQLRML
jgi:hypothetical protein